MLFNKAGIVPPKGADNFLCPLRNISHCEILERSESVAVIIYNPLPRSTSQYVRIPLSSSFTDARIYNEAGTEIQRNVLPVHQTVKKVPGRPSESANYDILFKARDLPPMGYKTYYLAQSVEAPEHSLAFKKSEDELNSLLFDEAQVKVAMAFYEGEASLYGQSSGAYIFRPLSSHKVPLKVSKTDVVQAEMVKEVYTELMDSNNDTWCSFAVREYFDEPYMEVEWLVGPISTKGALGNYSSGKEVVLTYELPKSANKLAHNKFWTDSNGRQYLERILNDRFSYHINVTDYELEPVSSNYYPITTGIKFCA